MAGVLKVNDVGGKLLNGIKSVYVNSLVCVRVKEAESEFFRIDSNMRHSCFMSPWLFSVYIDAIISEIF